MIISGQPTTYGPILFASAQYSREYAEGTKYKVMLYDLTLWLTLSIVWVFYKCNTSKIGAGNLKVFNGKAENV